MVAKRNNKQPVSHCSYGNQPATNVQRTDLTRPLLTLSAIGQSPSNQYAVLTIPLLRRIKPPGCWLASSRLSPSSSSQPLVPFATLATLRDPLRSHYDGPDEAASAADCSKYTIHVRTAALDSSRPELELTASTATQVQPQQTNSPSQDLPRSLPRRLLHPPLWPREWSYCRVARWSATKAREAPITQVDTRQQSQRLRRHRRRRGHDHRLRLR